MMPKNRSTAIVIDPKTVFNSIIDTCSKLQEFNFAPKSRGTAASTVSLLVERHFSNMLYLQDLRSHMCRALEVTRNG
jgi:hypothetical protein